jgi:hypothetical protein
MPPAIRPVDVPRIRTVLKVYRVSAIVTGTFLLLLCLMMVFRYGFGVDIELGGRDRAVLTRLEVRVARRLPRQVPARERPGRQGGARRIGRRRIWSPAERDDQRDPVGGDEVPDQPGAVLGSAVVAIGQHQRVGLDPPALDRDGAPQLGGRHRGLRLGDGVEGHRLLGVGGVGDVRIVDAALQLPLPESGEARGQGQAQQQRSDPARTAGDDPEP